MAIEEDNSDLNITGKTNKIFEFYEKYTNLIMDYCFEYFYIEHIFNSYSNKNFVLIKMLKINFKKMSIF